MWYLGFLKFRWEYLIKALENINKNVNSLKLRRWDYENIWYFLRVLQDKGCHIMLTS